ncbi:tetratricopeptide repeat protein [Crossiella sp. SN42]|uniref:ATP-binding protein n=1 Tax=Crossiella sp. SN42 TaxID=2944808 RepID=UPI00207C9B1C|nr:tetratricopeptide repeat protein [Crossiella sp. SN42]MCO1575160.1 tetratricopeptide repeat protein [Crossiella sp. SN42]
MTAQVHGVIVAASGGTAVGNLHIHQPKPRQPASTPPQVPPPRQLPRTVAHFTGREAELVKLDTLLGSDAPQQPSTVVISAIAGAAGIGKTSLAVHWAHRVQRLFPDGQLYVNLRGFDTHPPMTATHVLDLFLRALGLPVERLPDDVDAKASMYRSLLAGRRILIVLDNAATPDQIRPLLPNEPACLVLVTSRSRLSGLVACDGAHRISLDVLTPGEACTLLGEVSGRDRVDHESHATAELARRCAYLPLALRIAAEHLASRPHLTVTDLVEELSVEHRRLDVLAADDDEAAAVRAVFASSYHALPGEAARMFRLLGLHPGPTISLEATAALLDTTNAEARRQLDTLVSVHLLAEVGRDRYQFHDLLRTYAAERAAADEPGDTRDAATERLFQWYLHTAHAALFAYYPQHPDIPIAPRPPNCQPCDFTGRDHALRWFTAEHVNLVALIRHASSVGQYTVGCQLPQAIDCYLGERRHLADKIAVHQLGASAAQYLGDRLGEHWAYLSLGETYQQPYPSARQYGPAAVCLERALEIARKIDHKFGEGAALIDLAYNNLEIERYVEAVNYSQQALDINREIGHQRNESLSLVHLGQALYGLGQLDQALAYIQQGMNIAITIGAVGLQTLALTALAKIRHRQGDSDDALNHLMQAATHNRSQQLDHDYADTLNHLGAILNDMGRHEEARNAWREALAILLNLDPQQAAQIRTQLKALGLTEDIHQRRHKERRPDIHAEGT